MHRPTMRTPFLIALVLPLIGNAAVNFDREIRPILSDNCFSCHGPDASKRFANLRFDTADGGALANGVIVPGKSAESRLFQRITSTVPAKHMPPAHTGRSLTAAQVEALKQWIDSGAKWESHWAFIAPVRPAVPATTGWERNPIDNFVQVKLTEEGLTHSPEADKSTLLRRVAYDLTGLPPTIAEVEAFLADKSPNAYEKAVDRLLASPRYGERMAAPWLDLARYADTHGYHIDSNRDMWHWRDWVISAFNKNLSFDKFTIEQLAGDLIPGATTEQKLASGFNRNHMINFEGGAIPEEYQVEYVIDRLEATSTTWMGLTMGCARCHDHKYDPIPQKDFYKFFAFFNTVNEKGLDGRNGNADPFLQLPTPEQKSRGEQLKAFIAAHEKSLPEGAVGKEQLAWEAQALQSYRELGRDGLAVHFEFDGNLADSSGHYAHGRVVKGDLSYSNGAVDRGADFDGQTQVVFGEVPKLGGAWTGAFWLKVNGKLREQVFQWGDLEVWLDDFELSGVQQRVPKLYVRLGSQAVRTVARLPFPDNMNHIAVTFAGARFTVYVNGAAVQTEPVQAAASTTAGLEMRGFKGKIDDLRFYSRALTAQDTLHLTSQEPLRAILTLLPEKRSKEQKAWLRDYYLVNAAESADRKMWAELKALRDEEKKFNASIATTMVMSEMSVSDKTGKPRESFILARGDYRNQGEKVTPGVPSVLPPLPKDAPADRLSLATWLVDPANPLTARVAVNRYWQQYFGHGIVKTLENFGSQGEPPSNQALLDWLATEFVRTGWDVKGMQRLIVTSAAYRQSSNVTPELMEKDPENRLIARGPRFRLPAEMVRDGELFVSGLLKENVGGPSVFPYQPKSVWSEIAYGDGFSSQEYVQGHGDDLYRRSLYSYWKRTAPPPEMIVFDAPDREKCAARRTITNTPLQALALMNDPAFVEAARALAARMLLQGGKTSGERLAYGFRTAVAREPKAREAAVLAGALEASLLEYKRHEDRAALLLKNGESQVPAGLDKQELAAWTTVASMILNLDETITKQ